MLYRVLGWIHSKIISKTQEIVLSVLAAGPIPKHVAFVMDGNRRYARRCHKQILQGHAEGFVALKRVGGFYVASLTYRSDALMCTTA